MTITLELNAETEARLQAKAQAQGLSMNAYVKTLAEMAAETSAMEDAIALFVNRRLSQGEAAQRAGVSRAVFLAALNQEGVSTFQYESIDELLEEARG